jgi:hypothetical protein
VALVRNSCAVLLFIIALVVQGMEAAIGLFAPLVPTIIRRRLPRKFTLTGWLIELVDSVAAGS